MRYKKIKLQRRVHTVAISLPMKMMQKIGNDVEYLQIRQYQDGKITLWPIHEGVEK